MGSASRRPAGAAAPCTAAPTANKSPGPSAGLAAARALGPCCPAQRPAGRPGLPSRSCRPGRGKLTGAEARTKRPSPEPLGSHAAVAAAAATSRSLQSPQPLGRPPYPRAPGKSLHRRAPPCRRAAPGSAVQPLPALVPARSFGARTPGRWRSQPPRLVLSAGTRLLSPHCRPESPGAQAHSSRLASARNPRKDRPLSPLFSSLKA